MISIKDVYIKILLIIIFVILSFNMYADEVHLVNDTIIHCDIIDDYKYYIKVRIKNLNEIDLFKSDFIVKDFVDSHVHNIPKDKIQYIIDWNIQKKIYVQVYPFFNFEAIVGIWAPLGNNKVIGSKFISGLSIGLFIFPIININATLLGSNPEADTTYDYFGLEGYLKLIKTKSHQIDLLSGIGVDSVYTDSFENTGKEKSIHSRNISLGSGYKYFPGSSTQNIVYLSLQVRYHFIDLKKEEKKYLSKNNMSVRFSFGVNY